MTLDNLIGISLEKITPHPDAIKRLLHAAERNNVILLQSIHSIGKHWIFIRS
jgi:hypothetical protein